MFMLSLRIARSVLVAKLPSFLNHAWLVRSVAVSARGVVWESTPAQILAQRIAYGRVSDLVVRSSAAVCGVCSSSSAAVGLGSGDAGVEWALTSYDD